MRGIKMENEKHQLYIYIDESNNIVNAHTRFQSEPKDGGIDAGSIETRYVPFDLYKYNQPAYKWDGKKIIARTDKELDRVGYENGIENQKIIQKIEALEFKQNRAIRESFLELPGAKERLSQIDDQIKQLREKLL